MDSTSPITRDYSSVALDQHGNFFITWSSLGQDEADAWSVYGRRYSSDGAGCRPGHPHQRRYRRIAILLVGRRSLAGQLHGRLERQVIRRRRGNQRRRVLLRTGARRIARPLRQRHGPERGRRRHASRSANQLQLGQPKLADVRSQWNQLVRNVDRTGQGQHHRNLHVLRHRRRRHVRQSRRPCVGR